MSDTRAPGWGWSLASATLVVGLVAFFFPLAPFWTLLWLVGLTALFALTPLGSRWVATQTAALLSDVAAHPVIGRHPRIVAVAVFVLPVVFTPGVAWDLSDPGQRWNGGALWAIAVLGVLVRSMVAELRSTGHRARWWQPWLVLTIVAGALMLVGLPARVRWAHCQPGLTAAVTGATTADEVDISDDRWCWSDAEVRIVAGDVRLYTEVDTSPTASPDAGEGIAYSPGRAIETAGSVRVLVPLGDGWYWFETGSPVRDFWFDG